MGTFKAPIESFAPAPKLSKNRSLVYLIAGVALSLILRFQPTPIPFHYPFQILMTQIHELSHGLVALLTGGQFHNFVVYPDGSGLAQTTGGIRFLIIPAGYLGSSLFGALFLLLGDRRRSARFLLGLTGCAMGLLTLRYGVPALFGPEFFSGILTVLAGSLCGLALFFAAARLPSRWTAFLVHLIAADAILSCYTDLFTLLGMSMRSGVATDATNMAELTFVPATVWSFVWIFLCFLVTWFAMRLRFRRPR